MIEVDRKLYPLASKPRLPYNTLMFSPRTGEVWARIDRGAKEWFPQRLAGWNESPYPLPWTVPGSLFTDYDMHYEKVHEELPFALLARELQALERWTNLAMAGYNGATLSTNNPATIPEIKVTPNLLQRIAELRSKVAANSITQEELREGIKLLREDRMSSSVKVAAKRAANAPVNPDDALASFLNS